MSNRRIERVILFEYARDLFAGNQAAFLISYGGLTVAQISDIRLRLREAGSRMIVMRNSYIRLGLEANEIAIPEDVTLQGDTAVVLSGDDPVATAKLVKDFAKEFDQVTIKGGTMDGKFLSPAEIEALAETPPREVLLGMLLSAMKSSSQQLVKVISTRKNSIVWLLENYIKKLEEAQS